MIDLAARLPEDSLRFDNLKRTESGGGAPGVVGDLFARAFDALPAAVRETVRQRVDDMGARLGRFPHQRLQGRPEFKLRVGNYRVLYEFDLERGQIFLHFVGDRREIYKRT